MSWSYKEVAFVRSSAYQEETCNCQAKLLRTICLFVQKNPIGFNRTYSHSSVWNGIVLDPAYIGKKGGFRIKAQDMLAGNNPALMIHEKL